jgi:anthranilate phosphoribosyltransferase
MPNNLKSAINIVNEKQRDLTENEAYLAMQEMMSGKSTENEISILLTALAKKGESVSEISGMVKVMQKECLSVSNVKLPLLDTCGTGGAQIKTFNVSTASAFIASAAGANVAKHGNRAMTSKSGSADFLEALGAKIDMDESIVANSINEIGIGFMFAQNFHPAMKYVANVRKSLGIRTIFNLLGPLTNPASANCRILGTSTKVIAKKMAHSIANMNLKHALIVTGDEGIDEVSIMGPTHVYEVKNSQITELLIHPNDFDLQTHDILKVISKSPAENAQSFRDVISGKGDKAIHDFILINAGPALYVSGVTSSIKNGIELAAKVIENGDAAGKVAAFIEYTKKFS